MLDRNMTTTLSTSASISPSTGNPKAEAKRCLIIGAGIAGLLAARTLQERGLQVTVLDKGRGVGGRMATRRIGSAVFDHGAQFFTARDPRFQALVNSWLAAEVAAEWCRGFAGPEGVRQDDGHPRYRGRLLRFRSIAGVLRNPPYCIRTPFSY